MGSGGHTASALSTSSWYHQSRSSSQSTSWPVRRTTTTWSTDGVVLRASSTLALSAAAAPFRNPPSAVTTSLAPVSLTRSAIESGEKPPKMTVWIAPMRAQASIDTTASGIIGR